MILPQKGPHHLLLVWLIFSGLMAFGLFVSWHTGALAIMFSSDQSRLCWVIALIFLVVTVHAARRVFFISSQMNSADTIRESLEGARRGGIAITGGAVRINDARSLPPCLMSQFIHDVVVRTLLPARDSADPAGGTTELAEVYRHRLKHPHELGWFLSDIMIKLGLLGTIVGFVLMLGSVVGISDFDATTMQGVLTRMSYGMGTALYTTFAGLVCCILTNAQYYMLDQEAEQLVQTARDLAQTRVIPALSPGEVADAQKLPD